MKMSLKHVLLFFSTVLFSALHLQAQDVEIKFGNSEIALNETFRITVTVKNAQIRNLGDFPDIPGLDKRGTNTSSSVSNINGRVSSATSTIMNYSARKEGTYQLSPFSISVNGKVYKSPGITVKVGPPKQNSRRRSSPFGADPFDDFFGRSSEPQEFVEVEADAFFALTTNKTEVYRGEGVTTTLSFYVSNKNRAVLRFHDLGNQINEIVKLIRPENCWEENFNIDNINGVPVTLGNENYTQYKIFQATYFPLNTEDIEFRSIPLKMIKYKVAKNPSFFGRNKEEDFQTFYSKPKTVRVKDLPDHPLKENVAVGNYKLRETIDKKSLNTGESFTYHFDIGGIGNISAITPPDPDIQEEIEIYDPGMNQNIRKNNGKITGTKEFEFYGVPNEPGEYQLSDYFNWVFFNTSTEQYDTLASDIVITVKGESKKNQFIMANDLGSFYDMIEYQDNELKATRQTDYLAIGVNVLIGIMVIIGIVFLIKNSRIRRSSENT